MKYVALLAYNKIVRSHPQIVAAQEDTILSCIDDPDFSIRLEALKLLSGLTGPHNVVDIVNHLMRQLGPGGLKSTSAPTNQVVPKWTEDAESESVERLSLTEDASTHSADLFMSDSYKATVIRQILQMCSQNSYANVIDFRWYLQVLVQLCHDASLGSSSALALQDNTELAHSENTTTTLLGSELRNIAVRVTNVRPDVVKESFAILMAQARHPTLFQAGHRQILEYIVWVTGEYTEFLPSIIDTLDTLLLLCKVDDLFACVSLQAASKLVVAHINSVASVWDGQHRMLIDLLLSKVIRFCEQFITNPNVEIQERAVEMLELFRLAEEAAKNHLSQQKSPPVLLTHAIPSLFNSSSLNPVAPSAQRKVPIPKRLDLDAPINHSLNRLLTFAEHEPLVTDSLSGLGDYYHEISRMETAAEAAQDASEHTPGPIDYMPARELDLAGEIPPKGQERKYERHRDDPYYIDNITDIGTSAPAYFHEMITRGHEQDIDIDAIPVMDLDLEPLTIALDENRVMGMKEHQVAHITADEEIETASDLFETHTGTYAPKEQTLSKTPKYKAKRSLLQVDSSGVGGFESESDIPVPGIAHVSYDYEVENEAMTKALAEVEQARLEMQRAAERVRTTGNIPDNGTLVKKKAKRKTAKDLPQGHHGSNANVSMVKTKKKKRFPTSSDEHHL